MKHLFLITSLFSFNFFTIFGQSASFGFNFGVGTYRMVELEDLNEFKLQNIVFEVKEISSFPPYFYYRPFISFNGKNISGGFNYTYQSTGSRISSKDYSGEYKFDMLVHAHSPGLFIEIPLYVFNAFTFSFNLQTAMQYTTLTLKENFMVYEQSVVNDKFTFKAKNFCMEPGFNFSYNYGIIGFKYNLGYSVKLGNPPLRTDDNDKNKLMSPSSNEAISPNWNGLRTGLSLMVILKHK